jgi:hypothetical protein
MAPESMVHALEQIHALLVPAGLLIDIHPNGEPVAFILSLNERNEFIGYMQESDDYIEYRQADEAIAAVLDNGLFGLGTSEEFEFRTYADAFEELNGFLDENWSDAVIPDEVFASAKRLEREYGKRKVFLREKAKIALLKANRI